MVSRKSGDLSIGRDPAARDRLDHFPSSGLEIHRFLGGGNSNLFRRSSQFGGEDPFQRAPGRPGGPASPSWAGHETPPCDQGGDSPLEPSRAIDMPRGKPRGISIARQMSEGYSNSLTRGFPAFGGYRFVKHRPSWRLARQRYQKNSSPLSEANKGDGNRLFAISLSYLFCRSSAESLSFLAYPTGGA